MKKYIINVNGNAYEVEVEEIVEDKNMAKVPMSDQEKTLIPKVEKKEPKNEEKEKLPTDHGQDVIEAPMPGNIWKINVKEGQEVKAGEVLFILEAMKMENEIVAPRNGIVSKINTVEGSAVITGDQLLFLE